MKSVKPIILVIDKDKDDFVVASGRNIDDIRRL